MIVTEKMIEAACKAHAPQFDRMDPVIQRYARQQMRAALETVIALSTPVEDGWVLVPREPTEEMLGRGYDGWNGFASVGNKMCAAYRAMIAASPAPTVPVAQPVTVKALEWEYTERPEMTYTAFWVGGDVSYYIDQSFGSDSYYFRTVRWPDVTIYDGDDLPSAKAAAQADYEQRIRSALILPPEQPDSAARIAELEAVIEQVLTWANQRCPCRNEEPNPCPLCGANANKPMDICLSAENTIPRQLLKDLRLSRRARSLIAKEPTDA